jgi:hypothetical protein
VADAKSLKITGVIPLMEDLACSFGIISHRDTLWANFTWDEALIPMGDAPVIVKIFEETIDKTLA